MEDITLSASASDINEDLLELPSGLGSQLSREEVQQDIEERYLIPRTSFPTSWLSKCQHILEREPDFVSLTALGPSKPRTTLEIIRDGPDGRIIGYKEIVIGDSNLTAKNSTSMLRDPGATNFRGASNQFPFTPGGLESDVTIDSELEDGITEEIVTNFPISFEDDEILLVPPGFNRGLNFEDKNGHQIQFTTSKLTGLNITDMIAHDENEMAEFLEPLDDIEESRSFLNKEQQQENVEVVKSEETSKNITDAEDSVDDLLPTQSPVFEVASKVSKSVHAREYAHEVNIDVENFDELVPELALEFDFSLGTFQKQAIYHLENGDSVFVAAHTSSGKTVVAEYAIALAAKHMTKVVYTSPIKALSNQKYYDFKKKKEFCGDIGILTGDIQLQPESSCLIMTTEILRSMLYRGSDIIRDIEFVIFDEIHYINDSERGVVWEEVIILLPPHVNLILLSATVPNTHEFADWIGRTKKKDIYVISTLRRVVPLEHYMYANKEIYKIVDKNKRFSEQEWKKANNSLTKKDKESKGNTRNTNHKNRGSKFFKQDKNLWRELIETLKKKDLLPVINFIFSKKKCDEYAKYIANLDLCTSSEQSQIHLFIEKSLMRLKDSDRKLPQIKWIRELLKKGVAVHHSGLLPIIKEMVEILFQRRLVKVLFATETVAMGVNMPARTVVFSSLEKFDGKDKRMLKPGEYTQMAGRAGRRGYDDRGVVVIMPYDFEFPSIPMLNEMILGKATKLESQFRLTYNMILKLLQVEALKVEDMIKRSFSENTSQKKLPDYREILKSSEDKLSTFESLDCNICTRDINDYYIISKTIIELNKDLYNKISHASHTTLLKALGSGRIVVINNNFYRNVAAVILKPYLTSTDFNERSFHVFMLLDEDKNASKQDNLPLLPVTKLSISSSYTHKIEPISYRDIAIITRCSIKLNVDNIMEKGENFKRDENFKVTQELLRYIDETQHEGILEYDWKKINDMDFKLKLEERNKLMGRLNSFQCILCTDFIDHLGCIHEEYKLKTRLDDIKYTVSGQNLELIPEYEQRIKVLQKLNYIDQNDTFFILELKGKVACEISSADEVIVTELIFDNVFSEYDSDEIVALLSCFIFQEASFQKEIDEISTPRLKNGILTIGKHIKRVADIQQECGLNLPDYTADNIIKNGMVDVVYNWAKYMDFIEIKTLTDITEGSIVRCITRLYETCREVKNAARTIGDPTLRKKMEDAQLHIKRDIVFSNSLYYSLSDLEDKKDKEDQEDQEDKEDKKDKKDKKNNSI